MRQLIIPRTMFGLGVRIAMLYAVLAGFAYLAHLASIGAITLVMMQLQQFTRMIHAVEWFLS
ncbi:hypothetical protein [Leucobacter manosquensis]|uniref:Uncharacterized protein n=1 Tax=Leucobacter manosquensis TaxID=2810611 RepID=A0ABS5M581_9MICO|nr:hypothetical protein [Leucobacter manosquensis]MBS3182353.1 hypothetical protein [Leucobacter manosquensis]